MTGYFSSDFTLGILGGGQLGKMLLYETRKYDIKTIVLDPGTEAPSRIGCDQFFQGDLMDYQNVLEFGRKADVITLEIEAVNRQALEQLEREGKKIYPSPATLGYIQDKSIQKTFFEDHGIPTAGFQKYRSKQELKNAVIAKEQSLPLVWKSATGGYDGKGVAVIREAEHLDRLPEAACIAEDLVAFKNELAVIVTRNPSGEVVTFPVVEMEFHPEANQVEYVICPARIDSAIAEAARLLAEKVSKAFGHVGVLAVEMFQTPEDKLLVNEVAPRPHNSGHYSIEASYTNQFEQHLRAVLNLPLGNTDSKVAGVMVNLVGEEGHTGHVFYQNIEEIIRWKGVTPHIYGKKITRPFRKMGHVTIVHENVDQARQLAAEVKKKIKVISGKPENSLI